MKTANAIIDKALSFVGVKESPAYSNNVIFNTDYYGRQVQDGVPTGYTYAWCVTFGWDVFRLCGASDLFCDGKKTASCITVRTWGRNARLCVDKTSGRKGDIVLFDWNRNDVPDHFGFIVAKNADGSYTTVEGNTSASGSQSNGGEVMVKTRYLNDICEIIRPKYEEVEPVDKRYNKVSELPASLQPETQQLIDCGALRGVNAAGDLDITLDMDRVLIVSKRYTDMIRKVVDPGA